MSLSVQLAFHPATTPMAEVIAAVHRLYGDASGAAALAPSGLTHAENPGTGADPEEAGTATAIANADGTVVFDKNGLPWDARIHATPASQTKAGVWRKGRNVTDATLTQVTAELKAKYAGAVPAAAAGTVAGGLPALGGLAPLPGLQPAGPTPYQEFCAFLGAHMHSESNPTGRITPDWLKQTLTAYQVPGGELAGLTTAAPETITTIRAAIAGALGVA